VTCYDITTIFKCYFSSTWSLNIITIFDRQYITFTAKTATVKRATEKRANEKTATEETATGKLGNAKNRQRKIRG